MASSRQASAALRRAVACGGACGVRGGGGAAPGSRRAPCGGLGPRAAAPGPRAAGEARRLRTAAPRATPPQFGTHGERHGGPRGAAAAEGAAPKSYCPGCGIRLQDRNPDRPGFFRRPGAGNGAKLGGEVLSEAEAEAYARATGIEIEDAGPAGDDAGGFEDAGGPGPLLCARCYSLRNYGTIKSEEAEALLPAFDVGRVVGERSANMKGRRQVLLCVVDLADFAGSLPYGVLQGIVSRWGEARAEVGPRIVIAANKMDLLPRAATLRRLEVWVRTQWRASGLPLPSAVHVVSAARGSGISQLSESLAKECGVRGDVWVIGAQNAGKSSVINALKHDTDGGPGRKAPQVTEAPVPGTTIGIVRLEGILPSHRCRVFDTPGVEHPFQWSSTATPLSPTDVALLLPRRALRGRSFRVTTEQAVTVGGLARVEVLSAPGTSLYLTVWASSDIPCHLGKRDGAEARLAKFTGTKLTPPTGGEEAEPVAMVPSEVQLEGSSWKVSSQDVHIAGLGWVGVGLTGQCTLRVWTAAGIGVTTQPSLMPDFSPDGLERPGFGILVTQGKKKKKKKGKARGR